MSLPAVADKNDDCQFYAEIVEISADARDKGRKQEQLKKSFLSSEKASEEEMEIASLAVDYVYNYPRLPPREEANSAYEECMTV